MTAWEGLNPPYRTIVADPPWPVAAAKRGHGRGGRRARATPGPYSTMGTDELTALSVLELADNPSSLWLWITPALNREGIGARLMRGWGFTVTGEIIWAKPNLGMGAVPRTSHEILLLGQRGKGIREDAPLNVHSVQAWSQVYDNNGGKSHSVKPAGSFDLIEACCPGPYVELFARQPRLGWDHWGYGVEGVVA